MEYNRTDSCRSRSSEAAAHPYAYMTAMAASDSGLMSGQLSGTEGDPLPPSVGQQQSRRADLEASHAGRQGNTCWRLYIVGEGSQAHFQCRLRPV